MRKILAIIIVAGLLIAAVPALSPPVEASVYNYDITSVRQTGPNEVTVSLQVLFCSGCNPNVLSSPGCYPFTHGYPPPHHPYYHWCGGYVGGRYVAVRLRDEAGNIIGATQKLACNQINWPINQLITRDFVFPNVQLSGVARVTAEADVYCSWCGHWYPDPRSMEVGALRICIDAGHGGTDLGVLGWTDDTPNTADYPSEKYITLEVALNLKARLRAAGYDVCLTRTKDTDMGLQERCNIANNSGCDIFVSIHANASSSVDVHGTETYYRLGSVDGLDLAQRIQTELVGSMGLRDSGVKSASFHVLEHTNMPAALVEVGYMTNKGDYEFLTKRPDMPEKISVLKSDGTTEEWNLEEYLRGVVAKEMYSHWDEEALKAQSAASRTFALTNNHHPGVARVCLTTCCQAWTSNYNENADAAVHETRNVVIMRNERILNDALFFGHCIGQTRNSEDVWGNRHEHLRSVTCPGVLCNTPSDDPAHDDCRKDHSPLGYHGDHGLGMCQYGAQTLALQNNTYVDILNHYYTGVFHIGAFVNLHKTVTGIFNGINSYFEARGLTITAKCPVDLLVTDPDGLRICKDFTEIPGASYLEIDTDGESGVRIRIPDRKIGDYLIEVIPKPGALPTDTFTLEISLFGESMIIARNVQIGDIPTEPYLVISTEEGIIPPIIESTIDFDPDVVNLRTRGGVVTAYIELPEGYDVGQIDVSSIRLNDTVSALEWPYEVGDYNRNGIPDLMVKFDRRAVQAILDVGESVEITITGEVDGIPFMGTDTIRVINR